jgi:DNA-binding NtrC family response regulator
MHTVRTAIRLLVAVDEPGVRNLLSLVLKHHGYSVDFVEDAGEGARQLRQLSARYSAVLLDLAARSLAAELIEIAGAVQPCVPVIGLVNDSQPEGEWPGVDHLIHKPINGESLHKTIQEYVRRQVQERTAEETPVACSEFGVASSLWRNEIQPLIKHVAGSDIPVLVQGETGVGKEVLARQLHSLSPRAKKSFLKVNCAALPSELIESELFGYERGAFTGAFKTNPGKFEMAEGGTILLDEIGDMDFRLQAKLLQVLQDREFIRLGASEPRRVDVRVIAATHCDLERAIEEGRFREDLYYRLNIITLRVPALRDRKDEILPLAHHFLRKHSPQMVVTVEISPMLRDVLLSHDWPGNVRELENVMRKLIVLRRPELVAEELRTRTRRRSAAYAGSNADNDPKEPVVGFPNRTPHPNEDIALTGSFSRTHIPATPEPACGHSHGSMHDEYERSAEITPQNGVAATPRPIPVGQMNRWSILERVDQARREAETEAILNALNSTLWNRKRAAELLNIDYKALLYKMKKLGIVERAAKIAI